MPDPVASLVKGTLDLLVLRTLELQPLHGAASPSAFFRPREGRSRSRRDRCFPPSTAWNRMDGSRESGKRLRRAAASSPTV